MEDELDGSEGWVWYNAAVERENRRYGAGEIKISGDGYIKQEMNRIKSK